MQSHILGVKPGLPSREKKMTLYELHRRVGHLGGVDGCKCLVCVRLRGSMRRVYKKVAPFVVILPGYYWCADVITYNVRSLEGNKYCVVTRDMCTGFFLPLLWLETRD